MRIIYTDILSILEKQVLSRYQIDLIQIDLINVNIILDLEGCIGYMSHAKPNIITFYIKDKKNNKIKNYMYQSIFKYLEDHQYYKMGARLGLTPYYDQTSVVEFNDHFWKFINNTPFFCELFKKNNWIHNYLVSVNNTGVFFKLSKNKRQRTYWNPGLNGGLPMTNKKHKGFLREITFFCHDIGHFLLPDLIFSGSDKNETLNRQIYCLYRLLGEATTLPLNEMYLVNAYDRNKTIRDMDPNWIPDLPYLLFNQIKENSNIEQVLWASVSFFVKGDHSKFEELLNDSEKSVEVFNKFSERYEEVNKRGVEWTCDNYDNMFSNRHYYRQWWEYVKKFQPIIGLMTVDQMREYVESNIIDINDSREMIDIMYNKVLPGILSKLTGHISVMNSNTTNYLAFTKWMIGNMLLFFKYDFFDLVSYILDEISDKLIKFTNVDKSSILISECTKLYDDALKIGIDGGKIDYDDYYTFTGTYPMIDNNVLRENSDKKTLLQYLLHYNLIN